MSRFFSVSTASTSACSTILPSISTSSLTCLISLSNVLRSIKSSFLLRFTILYTQLLTVSAGDVPLGALVFGVGKDRIRFIEFNHSAGTFAIFGEHHHGGVIGGAGSLLHIVRHDHDGVVFLEFLH